MANSDLAYQHALDRLAAAGFDSLSERERDLVVLWQVEAGVNNGGFVRYFSGESGDLAFHAPEALARIGATDKAALVRTVNGLFGPEGPPRDRNLRLASIARLTAPDRAMIDSLERRYYDDPADVDELVENSLAKEI